MLQQNRDVCLVGVLRFALPPELPGLRATPLNQVDGVPFPCFVFDDDKGMYGYGAPIRGAWCVPLVYAPSGVGDVDEVMSTVAARNGMDAPVTASACCMCLPCCLRWHCLCAPRMVFERRFCKGRERRQLSNVSAV